MKINKIKLPFNFIIVASLILFTINLTLLTLNHSTDNSLEIVLRGIQIFLNSAIVFTVVHILRTHMIY